MPHSGQRRKGPQTLARNRALQAVVHATQVGCELGQSHIQRHVSSQESEGIRLLPPPVFNIEECT